MKVNKMMIAVVVLFSLFAAFTAQADEKYPARQVEYLTTYPPGGSMEIGTRIVQPPLQAALGVPVVVTYKLGVAGMLGADFLSKQKPDGYTIGGLSNSALITGPVMNSSIGYKHTDFIAIGTFLADEEVIACLPNAPYKTLEEMIAHVKKNPGKVTYASPGMGSLAFFLMELFKMANDLDIAPVHYQGSAPTVTAALGGHTDVAVGGLSAYLPQIKAGKLIPLVITGDKRLSFLPDVPTLKEKGVDSLSVWNGLFAPANTPKPVVQRLEQELTNIMKDPENIAKFEKSGVIPFHLNSEQTMKLMDTEYQLVTKVAKKLGLTK